MRPLLADARLKPTPADILWTRQAFNDLLRIRSSSTLFRLRGDDYPGAGFREVLYRVNVDTEAHFLVFDDQRSKNFVLHPVHRAAGAADRQRLIEPTGGRRALPAAARTRHAPRL